MCVMLEGIASQSEADEGKYGRISSAVFGRAAYKIPNVP